MRPPPYRRGQTASQQEKGICLPGSTSRAPATLGQIPSSLGCFALRGGEIEPVVAAQALGDAFEFLSDLVNRFPLPTLGGEYTRPAQPVADPVDAVAESSIADVGDASPALARLATCSHRIQNSQCAGTTRRHRSGRRERDITEKGETVMRAGVLEGCVLQC
ncbi:uncharacterized protein [Triticum aestivum]|uniref:uncharacterized protein n=1 Tax=Triticum aestivum TaxID=4565 RepID=UPI001D00E48E|nr:uncharacterized protein LOC123043855 [Triticum aestivum]